MSKFGNSKIFFLTIGGFFFAHLGCAVIPKESPVLTTPNQAQKENPTSTKATEIYPSTEIQKWCSELKSSIAELKWKVEPCEGINWKIAGQSVLGRPLVYAEFGSKGARNTTLIFSMVHGDEITPLYLGVQLAQMLRTQQSKMPDTRVVIAPLVNPDGFFHRPRTRVNARGVDINRNFKTEDWDTHALKLWKTKFRSDPRRYPGVASRSEPETIFQEEMIRIISPDKILSIHSPLNFLDYDGPGTIMMPHLPTDYVQECTRLRRRLKANSGGFFPGSLGNFAGHRGIPTITAELRSSDSRKADEYWKQVQQWIHTLIQFSVSHYASSDVNVKPGS